MPPDGNDRAAQMRADFPQMAKVVDDYRAVFGDVRVKWLMENGKEVGKQSIGWVQASINHRPPKPPKPKGR
jgi:hypothetical protein